MRLPTMLRSHDRALVCARCAEAMGSIHLAPFFLPVTVRALDGTQVTPRTAMTMHDVLRGRIAAETDAFTLIRLHEQVAYVRAQAGELVYELTCPCGAHYLRTLPRLHRQVRTAGSEHVVIG
jgi:hypothetical protein